MATTATFVDGLEELTVTACQAIEAFARRLDPAALTAEESARVLESAVKLRNIASGVELLVTSKAIGAPRFKPSGGEKAEDKLGRATGRSAKAARKAIDASKATQDLPVLDDAVRSGELSAEQADMIAEAAKANPAAQSDLIAKAKSEDMKGLRDACERARAAADPNPESTHRRVHRNRRVSHWTGPDGARYGKWALTPEAAAEVEHVLDAFTDVAFKQARIEGRRESMAAYRADGLLAMARAARSGDTAGVPLTKDLVVRVDHAAFVRGHTHPGETCEIRGLGPVPVSVARDIAADAFVKALLFDGVDVTLVKHYGRHISAELRTALMDRDQVCTDPGCNRSHGLEWDHEVPVAQHGPTSQANVGAKCRAGHKAKTELDNQKTRQLKRSGHLPPQPDGRGSPGGDPPPAGHDVEGRTGRPGTRGVRRGGARGDPPAEAPGPGPTLFDDSRLDLTWRQRLRNGGRPPEVGPFDDEGLRYR